MDKATKVVEAKATTVVETEATTEPTADVSSSTLPSDVTIVHESEFANTDRQIVKCGDKTVTHEHETKTVERIIFNFPSGKHTLMAGDLQLMKPKGDDPFAPFRSHFT